MLAELVLVTRILGLVSGPQPINVQVDPAVRSVEIVRDGEKIATLQGAPWKLIVDFGPELAPHELTAIAYDANGAEVARDTQIVNLARPAAEAAVSLDRTDDGRLRAQVRWQHIASEKPKRIEVRLDGKVIGKGATVVLPPIEDAAIHALAADVLFPHDIVARKELVFGGVYSEQVPTELTAVLVRQRDQGQASLGSCFQLDGRTLQAAAVEKGEARVYLVRETDPIFALTKLRGITGAASGPTAVLKVRAAFGLDAKIQILWPIAVSVQSADREAVANLFYRSELLTGAFGTHWLLTGPSGPRGKAQRFADAVAVGGVQSLNGGLRRAVVLVVGKTPDRSRQPGSVIRRYLERIGVPLRVWSLAGATPDLVEEWGSVTDISSSKLLRAATEELRRELESQRVAWLPVEPLEALRVRSTPDCAFATMH